MGSFMRFYLGVVCTFGGWLLSSVIFVCFLLAAAVLSNMLDNFFKSLSVASPNSKYGLLGFECPFNDFVGSFAAWKI